MVSNPTRYTSRDQDILVLATCIQFCFLSLNSIEDVLQYVAQHTPAQSACSQTVTKPGKTGVVSSLPINNSSPVDIGTLHGSTLSKTIPTNYTSRPSLGAKQRLTCDTKLSTAVKVYH
eukprot:2932994-Amphidinium_carterae.1